MTGIMDYDGFLLEFRKPKESIDAIGKHHSELSGHDRTVRGSAAKEYHGLMRNRASRLRSLRDRSGPNAPQTRTKSGRKGMLAYAAEDSRKAKELKARIKPGDYR